MSSKKTEYYVDMFNDIFEVEDYTRDSPQKKAALSGIKEEIIIAERFDNYLTDPFAPEWLHKMGVKWGEIKSVEGEYIKSTATKDGAVKVDVKCHVYLISGEKITYPISSKKTISNWNHAGRTFPNKYQKKFGFNDMILETLEVFSGYVKPSEKKNLLLYGSTKSEKRALWTEIKPELVEEVVNFFKDNKEMVIRKILQGEGDREARWMIITDRRGSEPICHLLSMDEVVMAASVGDVHFTGSCLHIGNCLIMKRCGGQGGGKTASHLNFQLFPLTLVKEYNKILQSEN